MHIVRATVVRPPRDKVGTATIRVWSNTGEIVAESDCCRSRDSIVGDDIEVPPGKVRRHALQSHVKHNGGTRSRQGLTDRLNRQTRRGLGVDVWNLLDSN